MSDLFLVADAPDGALLFACIAPDSRFTTPAVAHGKLSASLHPFANETEAAAALKAAGGAGVREWRRESVKSSTSGRKGRGR